VLLRDRCVAGGTCSRVARGSGPLACSCFCNHARSAVCVLEKAHDEILTCQRDEARRGGEKLGHVLEMSAQGVDGVSRVSRRRVVEVDQRLRVGLPAIMIGTRVREC
jgi:hypothetical protein